MKTSKKLIKKAICLFLIAILNINTFGAIVSDNDGSAFITKAEFDALKSSFQSQIDEYNTSIDSKIDGAIAAYLAGIKLSSQVVLENYAKSFLNSLEEQVATPIRSFNPDGQYYYHSNISMVAFWGYLNAHKRYLGASNITTYKPASCDYYFVLNPTKSNTFNSYIYLIEDSDGYIDTCLKDLQTNTIEVLLYSCSNSCGASLNAYSFSKNSSWQFNKNYIKCRYSWDIYGSYYYGGAAWYSGRSAYIEVKNLGTYYYSGDTMNSYLTQVCSTNLSNACVIEYNDYINNEMEAIDSDEQSYMYITNLYGSVSYNPKDNPNQRPKGYYGKPVSKSVDVSNIRLKAYKNLNLDNHRMWSGLPLCKSDNEGDIEFLINFNNGSYSENGTFCISDTTFSNTLSAEPNIEFEIMDVNDEDKNVIKTDNFTPKTGTYSVKFKGEKNKIYYVKYIPSEDGPTYYIDGDIIQSVSM